MLDGTRVVTEHVRSLHKGTEDLVLDHYLEVLVRKPGALPGATALAQAKAAGAFTDTHQQFWDSARRALGDKTGTHALIGTLLLHRALSACAVLAGMRAAIQMGRFDPDLVAVEARRHLEHTRAATEPDLTGVLEQITPIGARAVLRRAHPSLTGYDELLTAGDTR